jgi:hypothetical protein
MGFGSAQKGKQATQANGGQAASKILFWSNPLLQRLKIFIGDFPFPFAFT